MLGNASYKVACHAHIERSIRTIGQNVDEASMTG